MRTYLVVIDDSPEGDVALRFAARRAARTGGGIQILAVVERTEFVGLADVQQVMEAEARERAEAKVAMAAGSLFEEAGIRPSISVRSGEATALVREMLAETGDVAALVLGASATGAPGPLVATFTGVEAGKLPCPVMIVPGGLSDEAIDRLS
ncbi:nucleotide-binding universal stress UspA family protein [Sphingomonas jejuensis]|uniref:Nucleotide-binding universal stress UspA family protein n=1 Tax=Sphingomonas jejuensis TaxID=904715 RepID=A0ABX0XIK0_9SPHN|nr:universal stress protein [Sphingomonas jejuensis]NJC32555.1 nucleotide-binding universal stress UspA family protein [Sphingomonas jejuensis]